MKKYIMLIIVLALIPLLLPLTASADEAITLRVGLYENSPKIFTDDGGRASGFWPEIIEYIASEEGWQIEYISGTWEQCLERLKAGQIDVMPDVAYTEERSHLFTFSDESIYVSWSRLYAKKDSGIQSILDLEGKSIAVLEGSANAEGPEGIVNLLNAFDIHSTFIKLDSYTRVFKMVRSGEADAGVSNRDFANQNLAAYDLVRTPILFQPVTLYFAFPNNSESTAYLVKRIDHHIKKLKHDNESIYYQGLEKWLGIKPLERSEVPKWLIWLLGDIGVAAVLLAGGSLLLRHQIKIKTSQLTSEITEHAQTENALSESETRYRSTLDGMLEGCQIISRDWRYLYVNEAVARHGHRSREELLGHTMMEMYPGIERTEIFAQLQHCMKEHTASKIENEFVFPDGVKGWFELSIEPVPEGLFILSLDITERKQNEERIKHLNTVLYSLRGINQLITREKDRIQLIQHSCDLLVQRRGYTVAWILLLDEKGNYSMAASAGAGDKASSLNKELSRGFRPPCVQRALEETDSVVLFTDVNNIHSECILSPYHKGGACLASQLEYEGKVYGTITVDLPPGLAVDETEQDLFKEIAGDIAFALAGIDKEKVRIKWQNDLQRSEEKLRLMFEALSEGIIVIGLDNTIIEFNNAVLKMHGARKKADLLGKSVFEFVAEYDRERARKAISEAPSQVDEFTLLRRDGSEFPAEISAAILRDAEGNPNGIIAVIEDITERKLMEEQMLVTDRLVSIGELASGIAHELNNPLTGIIGLSELLLKTDIPEEIKEDLTMIHREARRTSRIVKNLLTFARKHKPEMQLMDINDAILSALELRAYELKVNNIEVVLKLPSSLPGVKADSFQLQQVFLNIIINAEHFMIEAHGKGKLVITTEQVNGIIKVSIADDGPGISKQYLKRIFDPFFTTKEVGKGTGLGLSICHGIITEHEGKIYAENRQGKGSVFIVELPAVDT